MQMENRWIARRDEVTVIKNKDPISIPVTDHINHLMFV